MPIELINLAASPFTHATYWLEFFSELDKIYMESDALTKFEYIIHSVDVSVRAAVSVLVELV